MIWTLQNVDSALIAAFQDAGIPDQWVIDAHLTRRGQRYQQERPGIKRWYYLHREEPRIRLTCVSMPLDAWIGGAFLIVGTQEIIGEFPGNQHLVGKKCLQMKMQPLAWMTGQADQDFAGGALMLAEISEQILDLGKIEQVQRTIRKKYQW